MKNNGLKIFFKNLVAFRKSFFKNFAVNAGVALAVHEAIEWITETPSMNETLNSYCVFGIPVSEFILLPWLYLLIVVLASFISQINLSKFSKKMNNGTGCTIEISMSDIFKNKGQLVVPCDDIFSCDYELIGDSSIKAQMFSRLTPRKDGKSSIEALNEQIQEKLSSPEYQSTKRLTRAINGKEYQIYDYGTIVPVNVSIDKKNRDVLLLAMSNISAPGVPSIERAELLKNIDKMWEFISAHPIKNDTLVVPVIGTGAAKASIDKQMVARYILYSFAEKAASLNIKKLVLCVYPNDYINDDIKLAELKEYAEFLCRFPTCDFNMIKGE